MAYNKTMDYLPDLEIQKGNKSLSAEHRAKISSSNKGRIVSGETRRKISEALKGRPGGMTGKHHSPESKQKQSISRTGKCCGEAHPMFGKKVPVETKAKMSLAATARYDILSAAWTGNKNPGWRGGMGKPFYSKEFRRIRDAIRRRDGKCQMPGCQKEIQGRVLSVHHIDFDKKNNSPSNLISLCNRCHGITQRGRRADWVLLFSSLQRLRGIYGIDKPATGQ